MTERIRELRLTAFRGVPSSMEISLGEGNSLVVFGENGTGKSTIADALEWYFTGEIELLAHEGRQHAVRHLGSAQGLETSVELQTGGDLSGRAVFPDLVNEQARALASRETFILRGRTLADFINKTKTEKWKSLAEILGLDGIDGLRSDLHRSRTELRRRAKAAADELEARRAALRPDGEEPSEEILLRDLRQVCDALGLRSPETLDHLTDPAWLGGMVGRVATRSVAAQRSALLSDLQSARTTQRWDPSVLERWNTLAGTDRLSLLQLLEGAHAYVAGHAKLGVCPLCGQAVAARELAQRLRAALLELATTAQALETTRSELGDQLRALAEAQRQRDGLRLSAGLLRLELPPVPASPHGALQAKLDAQNPIDAEEVNGFLAQLAQWDQTAHGQSAAADTAPSDRSESEDQRAMLFSLCQQIQAWRTARREAGHAARARELADAVYGAYELRQQAYLSEILDRINHRVAEIYEHLHPGEGLSEVSVEPWTAKGVELAVTFHGTKQRPPHGVLSESHLNSLAIALFLAMADTFNERVGFLVLDDVINSFDLEHRGSLADLLACKNDGQLIVLTHDRQFFEHLARRAPSWQTLELTSWSYEEGPRTRRFQTRSLLAEAQACLDNGDVNGAATKTRRALEEQLQEACGGLQALLAFRRGADNDRRELGELFIGLRRALKTHAKAWLSELEPLLKALEADVSATLNVEAHASRGRAAPGEVSAALERAARLDAAWSCSGCGTRVWWKGTPEAARCKCGQRQFPPTSAGT